VTLCVGKGPRKPDTMGGMVRRRQGTKARTLGRLAIAAMVGIFVLGAAGPALAADPYPAGNQAGNQATNPPNGQKPAQVLAQSFFNDSPPVAVSPSTGSGSGGGAGAIAFTGFNLLILLATALAALAIGFVLWRSQHRPSRSNT